MCFNIKIMEFYDSHKKRVTPPAIHIHFATAKAYMYRFINVYYRGTQYTPPASLMVFNVKFTPDGGQYYIIL